MDARFKRGDEVYLLEDRGHMSRTKYKVVEYFLGSIPEPFAKFKTKHFAENDHNYMIESVLGGEQRIVSQEEIE
jgi:hypothetical protein